MIPEPAEILVIGEALTDIIHAGDLTREHPGGSPANVALGLARLGVTTSFLTALGPDESGATIAARLADAGVQVLPESWSLSSTSSASASIQSDGSAEYVFDISWRLPENYRLPTVQYVHIGSIGAFLEPGADQVERLIDSLDPSVTLSFDPNIRAALVGDPVAARARFARVIARANLVKLSDEDSSFLYPGSSPKEAAEEIASRGGLVALTKGAAGSLLRSGSAAIELGPIPVAVADTVGAGDSYMAALLQWILKSGHSNPWSLTKTELHAAGSFAAQAAAITVTRHGAEPPTSLELMTA